ncbi:hypothetical protein LEMLEM_LOCUS10386, partial [Lemmus lemmus]
MCRSPGTPLRKGQTFEWMKILRTLSEAGLKVEILLTTLTVEESALSIQLSIQLSNLQVTPSKAKEAPRGAFQDTRQHRIQCSVMLLSQTGPAVRGGMGMGDGGELDSEAGRREGE